MMTAQILTLHFVVLSFDRYSRDDVVGEVRNDSMVVMMMMMMMMMMLLMLMMMLMVMMMMMMGMMVTMPQVMVELEGLKLEHSETCPLSLCREITPRSDKLRSQVNTWHQGRHGGRAD